MDFTDDIEEEFKEIIEAEFSKPVLLTKTGFEPFELRGIYDQTSFEIINEGPAMLVGNPKILVFIKPVDDALGRDLTEDDNAIIRIMNKDWGTKEILRDGQGAADITLKEV